MELDTDPDAAAGVRTLSINTKATHAARNRQNAPETSNDNSGQKRRRISALITEPLDSERITNTSHTLLNQTPQSTRGQYDHLLHWEQDTYDTEEEEESDVEVGDNEGDNEGDDEGEEESREVPEDDMEVAAAQLHRIRQQSKARVGKISPDDVARIINESIETFTTQWFPGKGQVEATGKIKHKALDPCHIWEEAEALGRREQLVQIYKANIEYWKDRLDVLSDEIWKVPQNTADDVRKACSKSLETTVDLIQEAEWLISIYELPPDYDSGNERPQNIEVIDLGSSSESSDHEDSTLQHKDAVMVLDVRARTAVPKTTFPSEAMAASRIELDAASSQVALKPQGSKPEIASIQTVSRWNMQDLVAKADRKRIVQRVLLEMSGQDREMIRTKITYVRKQDLLREIQACVVMLHKKETKIQGVLPKDLPKIIAVGRFFLCWWFADNYFAMNPTEEQLEELVTEIGSGCPDLEIFYDWVRHIFSNTFSIEALKTPHAPSQSEIIVISDDED